jgi:hypothetical protein
MTPRRNKEIVMKKSNDARRPRQQTLPFPTSNGPLDPWNQWSDLQHQQCRQALIQLLLAVAQDERNAVRDERNLSEIEPE